MSGFLTVGYFLTSLFFSLVLFLLWARIALRYFRVSVLHPVSHAINTFTDPVILPVERLFSSKKAIPRKYDLASFIVIIAVEFIKFIMLGLLLYSTILPLSYLLLFVLTDLIATPCNLLFYLILIRVIMSWVNPVWKHPVSDIINLITNPLLKWGRSIIPDISGFDFSPYIVMIILKVITLFMSASMPLRLV